MSSLVKSVALIASIVVIILGGYVFLRRNVLDAQVQFEPTSFTTPLTLGTSSTAQTSSEACASELSAYTERVNALFDADPQSAQKETLRAEALTAKQALDACRAGSSSPPSASPSPVQ